MRRHYDVQVADKKFVTDNRVQARRDETKAANHGLCRKKADKQLREVPT
jgi:hypothetical protein